MVIILDSNLEIGAHVWSNLCYLIYLRHLIRSRGVTFWIFFSSELPSNSSTMDLTNYRAAGMGVGSSILPTCIRGFIRCFIIWGGTLMGFAHYCFFSVLPKKLG